MKKDTLTNININIMKENYLNNINTIKKNTLNNVNIDTEVQIRSLNCTGSLRRRLLDFGLIKGTCIKPILVSPSGDPTAYEVRGSIIALRKIDSEKIIIRSI